MKRLMRKPKVPKARLDAKLPESLKEAAVEFYESRGDSLTAVIKRLLEGDLKANGIDPYATDPKNWGGQLEVVRF